MHARAMRIGLWGALLAGAALLAAGGPAQAGSNRFWLASQHEFGARRGFYLNFENSSEGAAPCKLETLRLILGVGDGKEWRFPSVNPEWELGHDYVARAVIGPKSAELWLDGACVARADITLMPSGGAVTVNHMPPWASDPAEYVVLQSSLRLECGGKRTDLAFPSVDRAPGLLLFEPQMVRHLDWEPDPAQTTTLEAKFRIIRYPDLRALSPFIDRYGQCRYADWPGKIRSDGDLRKARDEEAARLKRMGEPKGFDRYGGATGLGWKEKPTGFYRTVKRDGFWWLVSPEGNPCFYLAMCSAPGLAWETTPVSEREFLFEWLPERTGPFAPAWAKNHWGVNDGTEYCAFHTVNMIRKYGDGWERRAEESARRRIRTWGFGGVGKWGGLEGMPSLPVLHSWGVPKLVRHPDVFDPAVQALFREKLREQVEPHRNSPFVVGWSYGNEYEEIVTKAEVGEILAKAATVPARRALVEYALDTLYGGDVAKMAGAWGIPAATRDALHASEPKPPAADIEKLRCFYEERYHGFIYRTLKELDPNHLYLGFWIVPGWWESDEDWRTAARNCDVIGYDRYSPEFTDKALADLMKEADKPVLCGEYSYPAFYGGQRGYGLYGCWAEDDANSGDLYQRWMDAATANPYCVGLAWFQYRDQPLTGRGPGRGERLVHGEHYAFGVVDVTDRPKWDLVERMRSANLGAAKQRMAAARK